MHFNAILPNKLQISITWTAVTKMKYNTSREKKLR